MASRNLDLVLLRAFVAVAEQRGMTSAAVSLHLSQGAVSQQIKRLEESLGGPLLTRDRRGIRLTRFGERLLSKARQLLALNDLICSELDGDAIQGTIRLGVPHDLAGAWIAPALKAFVEANPQVELTMTCGSSIELKSAIETGTLDIAIVEEPTDSASAQCLSIERLVWVGAKGGTAFLKTPLPVSMVAETCAFRRPVITALERHGRQWKTLFENGSLEATVAMVSNDLAISVWLQSTVPVGLEILPAEAQLPELPHVAISLQRAAHANGTAVDELLRCLRQHRSG